MGHRVTVTGRDRRRLDEFAAGLGQPERLDAVVANAAIGAAGDLADGDPAELINPGRVATPFWDPYGGPPEGALLTAEAVADTIAWAIGQPPGVDVNTVTVRPVGAPF
jgi:hypothetical protein